MMILPPSEHISFKVANRKLKASIKNIQIKNLKFMCNNCLYKSSLNIGIMVRVFTNGQRDRGSIPGQVIPKTQKMVLDATLLNTQH